jgi:hypothetical protein
MSNPQNQARSDFPSASDRDGVRAPWQTPTLRSHAARDAQNSAGTPISDGANFLS